ncbi:amidase signature enzyme [Achaetomium macrosporum]|uniref:Amidase signature enzyme n=1 Tax=Achaetomium macrosporum TaxID=79813 RepID=A0AAN7C788_9PEZI|nr:amidase signature enzyme [Achaetomium macrosporum]
MVSLRHSPSARSLGLLALSLLSTFSTVSARLTSHGLSVTLNDAYYYISPFSGSVVVHPNLLKDVPAVFGFKPVTVIQGEVAQAGIQALLVKWDESDDVFQPAFARAIFLAGCKGSCKAKMKVISDASSIVPLNITTIPSGPYFLEMATGSLYPVYRLYEDFAGAFMQALIHTPDGKFQPMFAQIPGSAALTVGVPSRLYFTKTAAKPLAGVRLGVKDISRLAGVKGSNGNRAWYDLYPPATYTGPAIQRLIDAGAVVVGTQKTSQFANGESATADWVDYHSPFNPRGDGDTGGSIRGPAGVQGPFGNRPSHGLVSLDNVMPLSPTLDTAGFLVRDTAIWDAANAALYGSNYTSLASSKPKYPKTIRTIEFPTDPGASAASKLLIDFLNSLVTFVGGTVTLLNLATEWAATGPKGPPALAQYLNTTYPMIITKEQIQLVREPFYRDYAVAHDGRRPFVNPVPLVRWSYGDIVSASQLQDQDDVKASFMKWFNTEVLPPVADPKQCSSGLVLYIGSSGGQNPRNRYSNGSGVPFGFSSNCISVLVEVPDSVFPVGEVLSRSAITAHDEALPVAIDINAAKGCDGLLVKLAQDLVKAGIIPEPRPGGSINGGAILMRRSFGAVDIWN